MYSRREMMRSISLAIGTALVLVLVSAERAAPGIVAPRDGGPLPRQYIDLKQRSRSAFMLKHGWIARRDRQLLGDRRFQPFLAAPGTVLQSPGRAVNGHFAMPVVMGLYSDTSRPPITNGDLDTVLFTGPLATGTLAEYYRHVSYNLLEVTGTVFDWIALTQNEDYYTGGRQGLEPGVSRTGEMIKELVDALDPTTDFGAFDNDGPDGVPNSGDDDGFVDVLLVVHPTWGAECGGINSDLHMWSHSFTYSSWPASGGVPYATNDPAANGGTIKIDDYILVPAVSCDKTSIIEIGVICHEFGHVLGLPDLYDWNGNSSGIGYWGLMGAGNWNMPESPAELCAWSREQLGWLNPVEIDWRSRQASLRPVETSADVLKMTLPTRRFKRQQYVLNNYGLLCSYPGTEATVRGWPGFEGYGNGWNESRFHEFAVDASRPVTLEYDVSIDVERNWDFGKLLIEIGGGAETLAVYTGSGSKHETIDLGARLPTGPGVFTLRFLFLSDFSVSDEDGGYDSRGGYTFTIDNVRLTGGGIDYFADFELDSGGWRDGSAPAEYFLVENRRRLGFDRYLMGQGLVLWHAENSILYSYLGNSGGPTNTEARGLVLEEADGEYNLIIPSYLGGNFGDAGDPYPGSMGNTSFGPTTVPRNQTNGGVLTPVTITGISFGSSTSAALFTAGMPAPTISAVVPDTIDKEADPEAVLDIRGAWMQFPSRAYLSLGGDTVTAEQVSWLGNERIIASFPIERLYAGRWYLTVVGGDGQPTAPPAELSVESVFASAEVTTGRDYLRPEWRLKDGFEIRGCVLFRSQSGGAFSAITDTLRETSGRFAYTDSTVTPEVSYSYKIVVYLNGGREEIFMLVGPYGIERLPFIVDQNYPNPFNHATTLSFFVPAAQRVTIEVFDVSGRLVERVADREYGRGDHTIPWDPTTRGVRGGLFFCRMRSGAVERVIKMVYLP